MANEGGRKTDGGGSATKFEELPPAAQRALREAEARRRARDAVPAPPPPKELAGRAGPDPVRFGDWENKGVISDF
ncbi:DUF1674 domain-containing protein [Siculibacillus lacustris]|uniref:DUF1674 domain-containing protein n=1 Tax=Siculibacillus lacustris TaxID=1549641 RepID=A0A4Q9VV38_9HYPH|nr:DUF1674 domain-containing protein [Siculibacillus lacustris]TBW40066.1 DUF1674 domain-containing protein [Siculibacillus lacustris]